MRSAALQYYHQRLLADEQPAMQAARGRTGLIGLNATKADKTKLFASKCISYARNHVRGKMTFVKCMWMIMIYGSCQIVMNPESGSVELK